MARYGENLYGTVKYGLNVQRSGLSWVLEIDWEGNGYFSGYNDARYMEKLSIKRGRDYMVKSDGKGFEDVKPGTFTATILNTDGRYNPYNTSSPLYPHIAPNKNFRLRVIDDTNEYTYPIMIGQISDIRPLHDGGIDKVQLTGVDKLQLLKNAYPTGILDHDKSRSTLFPTLLNSAGWNDGYDIQTVIELPDSIPYWWAYEKTAFDNLKDLSDSVLGNIFIANDGRFKFYALGSGGTDIGTFSGSDILQDYAILTPWDVNRNDIKVVVNNLGWVSGSSFSSGSVMVWKPNEVLSFVPGETKQIFIKPTYNNIPVIIESLLDDSELNSKADGTGVETGIGLVYAPYGYTTELYITDDNYEYSPMYLVRCNIYAIGVTKNNVYSVESKIQSSIDKYGQKQFTLDCDWIQTNGLAIIVASTLNNFFSGSLIFPTVKILNKPSKQFVDLFDKVTLNIPDLYINNQQYNIASIKHEWKQKNGDICETTFGLEPVIEALI